MKLTKRRIDEAEHDPKKPLYLWDSTLSGFGVKILQSGKKRYIFKYRPHGGGRRAPTRWMTIGTHGEIPLETARNIARECATQVAKGEDPQSDKVKKREAPSLSDLWDRFDQGDMKRLKPATIRDYHSLWKNILEPAFGNRRVADISRADVDRLHSSIGDTPYQANRSIAVLSKMMTLAEIWEWRDQGTNPCRYVRRHAEGKRERYLSREELGRLGAALTNLVDLGLLWPDMANLFRLLLLVGARRNEISNCEWSWIDWDRRIIALPDSKTGAKPLFLSSEAITVLQNQKITTRHQSSKFVFPGVRADKAIVNLSKPWKLICEEAKLEDLRIHDLRHTAASIAVGQGVALPIIGRLLGHTQTQTTARYAHVDADPALRAADTIGQAIGGVIK
ncbi:tyrosine-type recombinase/integrase [Phaeobacter gallaeciensis]|uniref:tyrosine-type recombinase/integrase n=1 Tax=Phaeobacter gallaeciensis TaxID=60890 RepID=UPI00237FCB5C|nr:site-specific integrase [Phaeobacter gallaeciensis]MDE4140952.1 site-specific integrase [Phaeobacter gallaeciensis]MDE4149397.1 site-specific integrase [Phaeobacter gallaeciensis]MDE4153410.1 site-specific integrase [Phaeobacter gallaeciensis]MDE4228799.1 site-specific integrase [Phaeobacter gallaeciensis]MDE4257874.1 site-specific integrase [Phaeobacter gallaeciensis]